MKRKLAALLIILFFSISSHVLAEDDEALPPLPKGPLLLTSARPEMLNAAYWIAKLPDPNRVLKTLKEMEIFNEEIDAMVNENVNVFKMGTHASGIQIKNQIQLEYDTLAGRKLLDSQDKAVPKSYFEENVKPILDLDKIGKGIVLKWAAATRASSVRALPTTMKMIEGPGDTEFDQLQYTLIKLWTPVAIYHMTTDSKWYYIQAPYVRGWVLAKDIAIFDGMDALKEKAKSELFLAVTGESVPVFSDAALTARLQKPTMGTVIPLAEKGTSVYTVWMPSRGEGGRVALSKGYISKESDVREGFPPYTQANVIRQAFKLLGARYGWGGMYNGRDCSGFTHDVFLSMGVFMPRDSKRQPYAGTQLGHYEPYEGAEQKAAALRTATPGITLMRMPLHIMIYLGEENDHFYAIHSTWAERVGQDPVADEKRRINQVVMTDLGLNGNSYLGGLFDRIIQITEVN
ncbi:MAG: SH3 domain-containing protein [Candidatus Omnitrophica bacterium]|nr:SH3 domain-containing protein [Candidatus Omnitrophota bacterium]